MAVGVVIALDLLWVGGRLLAVRGHLVRARSEVATARREASQGHLTAALAAARAAQHDAAATGGLAGDPVWAVNRHLPVLGSTLVGVQGLAAVAGGLARDVVPPLSAAAADLRAENLRLPGGGGIDVTRLRSAANALDAATVALSRSRAEATALPASTFLGVASSARADLLHQLDDLQGQLRGARLVTRLAPDMLGARGPRRYFLALQNTAEARGTGGIIGAYGVVVADRGRLALVAAGGDSQLMDFPAPVTTVSPDFARRWGAFGAAAIWRNSNLSPHYPWTTEVISALYAKRFFEPLDGVVTLDPGAAGYVLEAAGPARLPDGTSVRGQDLTEFVEKTLYERYADRQQRQNVLTQVQRAIFSRLIGPGGDPGPLLAALGRAAGEGRLLVGSTHPAEQRLLAGTAVAGVLPNEPGPYAALVLTNSSGDKLDYYLDRDVSWSAGPCGGPRRTAVVRATLTNTAPPSGLPGYVDGHATIGRVVPTSYLKEYVSVYGSVDATLVNATLDGQPVVLVQDRERGHPVASLYVTLPPGGGRHTVEVTWDEPSTGPVHPLHLPPLVRDPVTHTAVPACD